MLKDEESKRAVATKGRDGKLDRSCLSELPAIAVAQFGDGLLTLFIFLRAVDSIYR